MPGKNIPESQLTSEAKAKIMSSQIQDYVTPKQQAFISAYIANGGQGSQAALAAGYSQKDSRNAACRMLKLEKIQKRLIRDREEQLDRLAVNADWIVSKLMKEAENAESDATRVRALELLGKVVGVFAPEKRQIDAHISNNDLLSSIDLTEDDDDYGDAGSH
jgi:phage terminase small subunit